MNYRQYKLPLFIFFASFAICAAQPVPIIISNPGFERVQENDIPAGWKLTPTETKSRAVTDSAEYMNNAREGAKWLVLEPGSQVAQILKFPDNDSGSHDRLFVSFTASSVQDAGGNQIDLRISLVSSEFESIWRGGEQIASADFTDLSNDNRDDPNSFVDGYAVLKMGDFKWQRGKHCWLVIENLAEIDGGTSPVTIDQVAVSLAGPPPDQTGLPNILIVFQDDMGYGDASCFNPDSKIRTPFLDRLASQGMRLMDMHSAATICGPSRVGLLTGTIPDKLGVHGNFAEGGKERMGPPTLPEDTPTIATLCRQAGYDTAVVGKWGIPSNWDARVRNGVKEELTAINAAYIVDFRKPLQNADMFGFSYRYIYDEQRPFILRETAPYEGTIQPFGWHENGFAVRDILAHSAEELHESYLRAITDRAVRYIQTKAGLRVDPGKRFRITDNDAPFFLHYLTHAPHLPLVPAAQFKGMSEVGDYGDFVINLDYSLGRLMRALRDCGLEENTLVVFSSDNGPEHFAYGRIKETGHYSMGSLRGVKRDLYEGGHRVPTVVRWPREIEPGSVSDALVSMTDWYATVADITSQHPDPATGLDSVSLLPVLTGDALEVRGLLLQDSAVGINSRAIRSGDWVYIDAPTGELNRNKEPDWFRQGKQVADADGNELYNLFDDPAQARNLIRTHQEKAAFLKTLMEEKWKPGVRSTPVLADQKDSDGDGYFDFHESFAGEK